MENLITHLPQGYQNHVICIAKTGSQLVVDNGNDIDYLIITDLPISKKLYYIPELKADCFIYGLKRFKRSMVEGKSIFNFEYCLAYYNNENVVYGELPPLEIDIFSQHYMRKILAMEYAQAQKTYFAKYPLKSMAWGLALYYAIVNNSFEFTDEQKIILQKTHDLELDISYRDELKLNMESILYS